MRFSDKVFYKDSVYMIGLSEASVRLIITYSPPPPYFSLKDYSKNECQNAQHSEKNIQAD